MQNAAADAHSSQRWTTVELVLMAAVAALLLPLLYVLKTYRAASSKALATSAAPPAAGSPAKASKKSKSKKGKQSNKAAAADADAAELQELTATAVNGMQPGFDPVASSAPAVSSGDIERSSSEMQALLAAGQALHAGSSQMSRPASAAGSAMGVGSPLRSPSPSDPGAISPVPDGASGNTPGMMTTRSYVDEDGAVVIGRLRVGPGILGYGSAGALMFGGG
jgi:hypothetical protein